VSVVLRLPQPLGVQESVVQQSPLRCVLESVVQQHLQMELGSAAQPPWVLPVSVVLGLSKVQVQVFVVLAHQPLDVPESVVQQHPLQGVLESLVQQHPLLVELGSAAP